MIVGCGRVRGAGWHGSWRVTAVAVAAACAGVLMLSAPALASSLSLSFSGEVIARGPVTVTADGVADASSVVYLAWHDGEQPCAGTAATEAPDARRQLLWPSDPVSGSFSTSKQWVPDAVGKYRLCGYLNATGDASQQPEAVATVVAAARAPQVSLALGVSDDPVQRQPITVTVGGSSDVPSYAFAAWVPEGGGCSSNAGALGADAGQRLVWGAESAPGSISQSAQWTADRAGDYVLCGFLTSSASEYDTPLVSTALPVHVRAARADVALTLSGNTAPGVPLTITASGTTEATRSLYLASAPCRTTPLKTAPLSSQRILWPGQAGYSGQIGPGAFSQTTSWLPPFSRRVTLCALFADPADYSTALATATQTFITCCAPTRPVARDGMRFAFGTPVALKWSGGYATKDEITVFRRDPAESDRPVPIPALTKDTRLLPGLYWWQVTRHDGDWAAVTSAIARFRVTAPPLMRPTVKVSVSRTPIPTAYLRVAGTPFALVTLRVTHRGKTIARRTYRQAPQPTGNTARPRTIRLRLGCDQPGRFDYRITVRDARGARRSRAGHWQLAPCARAQRRADP